MVSQGCYSRDVPVPTVKEEWQVVSTRWWSTPFSSVSWSYEPEEASQDVIFAKPPHYHLSFHEEQSECSSDDQECGDETSHSPSEWHPSSSTCRVVDDDDDDALNEELIGVKNAREVLKAYEEAVGFDYSPWPSLSMKDLEKDEKWVDDVSEADVQLGKDRWIELVNDLVGGRSLEKLLREARVNSGGAKNVLQRTLATSNNIDYFSRPSTPKPSRLNPSASSFVPLGSPTSTLSSSSCSLSSLDSCDPLGSFAFPSLNTPLPSPPNKHKPDHQEYASSLHTRCRTTSSDGSFVASFERSSSGFLPSFLFDQRRRPTRTSRTRAIVDQLRSQFQPIEDRTSPVSQNSSPTISDSGVGSSGYFKPRLTVSDGSSACSITPPLTEEDFHHHDAVDIVGWTDNTEGWTIPPVPAVVDQETKRMRSKELLMTLRRRTDSLTSNANTVASLAAARSRGVVSASTPPALIVSERLVESPEPVQAVGSLAEEEDLFERSNQTPGSPVSSLALHRQRAGAQSTSPEVDYICTSPQDYVAQDTGACDQSPVYSQTYPKTANATQYSQHYITNPGSGLPYHLFGYPLPVPGVSMNMGVPVHMPASTMAMGTSRGGVQFPVQMPVQIPVQTMRYSTLMHLRIMQQMQMVRNSMNMATVGRTNA